MVWAETCRILVQTQLSFLMDCARIAITGPFAYRRSVSPS
jgi:hypothetical protein